MTFSNSFSYFLLAIHHVLRIRYVRVEVCKTKEMFLAMPRQEYLMETHELSPKKQHLANQNVPRTEIEERSSILKIEMGMSHLSDRDVALRYLTEICYCGEICKMLITCDVNFLNVFLV